MASSVSYTFNPLEIVNYPSTDYISDQSDGVVGGFRAVVHLPSVIKKGSEDVETRRKLAKQGVPERALPSIVDKEEYTAAKISATAMQFEHEDSVFSGSHGDFVLRLLAALVYTRADDVRPDIEEKVEAINDLDLDEDEDLLEALKIVAADRNWESPGAWREAAGTPEVRAQTVQRIRDITSGARSDQLEARDKLQHAARRVFFGYRVFSWDTWQVFRNPPSMNFADTRPSNSAAENLANAARVSYNSRNSSRAVHFYKNYGEFSATYESAASELRATKAPGRRVIVAGDASYVILSSGRPESDKWLVDTMLSRYAISTKNIPIYTVEDAEEVVRALMDLAPAENIPEALKLDKTLVSFEGAEISVCPYLDMRFGAWPPWLSLTPGVYISILGNIAFSLAYAATPALFFANMFKDTEFAGVANDIREKVKASYQKNATDLDAAYSADFFEDNEVDPSTPVFFSFRAKPIHVVVDENGVERSVLKKSDPAHAVAVGIGELGVLKELLNNVIEDTYGKNISTALVNEARFNAVWTRLTTRRQWLLFGPPLHLFVAEKMPYNEWVKFDSVFRLEPDAPKLQVPAKLAESTKEEKDMARKTFSDLARSWFTEDSTIPAQWVAERKQEGAIQQEQAPPRRRRK